MFSNLHIGEYRLRATQPESQRLASGASSLDTLEAGRAMLYGVRRLLRYGLLGIYVVLTFFVSTVLLFIFVETSESVRTLLNLHAIRYYAFLERYVPDPQLVFVPRQPGTSLQLETKGDLYSPNFNVEVERLEFTWTYTREGFRPNSSSEPYNLLVIGDSFIEIGESDSDTLTERIARETGLSTFNLGRGWYGPYQYLELLRRYGFSISPSCVLFSFFNGNDLRDITEYHDWLNSGWYYGWRPGDESFLERYFFVAYDVIALLRKEFHELRGRLRRPGASEDGTVHPTLGIVRLADEDAVMAFGYRHVGRPPEEAMASSEWRTLKSIIAEFRDDALQNGIEPIVTFIPTKLEVYAPFVSKSSGPELLKDVEAALGREFVAGETLRRIAAELDIAFINLLPEFRARAERGEALYYPFDTHWNSAGRQAGAEVIARALKDQAACWQSNPDFSNPEARRGF